MSFPKIGCPFIFKFTKFVLFSSFSSILSFSSLIFVLLCSFELIFNLVNSSISSNNIFVFLTTILVIPKIIGPASLKYIWFLSIIDWILVVILSKFIELAAAFVKFLYKTPKCRTILHFLSYKNIFFFEYFTKS